MTPTQFTVEELFTIRGRGIVLHGVTIDQYHLFKVGDRVSVQRPDGSMFETTTRGVESLVGTKYLNGPPPVELRRYGILVAADGISADDVAHGSIVTVEPRRV